MSHTQDMNNIRDTAMKTGTVGRGSIRGPWAAHSTVSLTRLLEVTGLNRLWLRWGRTQAPRWDKAA